VDKSKLFFIHKAAARPRRARQGERRERQRGERRKIYKASANVRGKERTGSGARAYTRAKIRMNSEEKRQFVSIFVNAAPMNSLIGFPSASRSATPARYTRAPCLTPCLFRRIKTRSLIPRDPRRSVGATFLLARDGVAESESIEKADGQSASASRESRIAHQRYRKTRQTSSRDPGPILSPRCRGDRVLLAQSSRSAATSAGASRTSENGGGRGESLVEASAGALTVNIRRRFHEGLSLFS